MTARRFLTAAAIAASLTLAGAPGAAAGTVTVGSPLTKAFSDSVPGTPATFTSTSLDAPGAMVSAPADGIIRSWRVTDAAGGPLKLRVIRPLGGGLYTGAGTAVSGPITGPGVLTFQANLPVRKGDLIGLGTSSPTDAIGTAAGQSALIFGAALIDGSPNGTPGTTGFGEIGVNAQVALNCVVPKLKGKAIGKAKKRLRAAGCDAPPDLGKKKKGKSKGRRIVKKQKPAPGTVIPSDVPVILKLRGA